MRRADRTVLITKLVFLAVFAASCAGIWWYELAVARPRAACLQTPGGEWNPRSRVCRVPPQFACEHHGGWWDPISKACAKVISVPSLTGRPVR